VVSGAYRLKLNVRFRCTAVIRAPIQKEPFDVPGNGSLTGAARWTRKLATSINRGGDGGHLNRERILMCAGDSGQGPGSPYFGTPLAFNAPSASSSRSRGCGAAAAAPPSCGQITHSASRW